MIEERRVPDYVEDGLGIGDRALVGAGHDDSVQVALAEFDQDQLAGHKAGVERRRDGVVEGAGSADLGGADGNLGEGRRAGDRRLNRGLGLGAHAGSRRAAPWAAMMAATSSAAASCWSV